MCDTESYKFYIEGDRNIAADQRNLGLVLSVDGFTPMCTHASRLFSEPTS
jgi:hypothetical protein